MAKAKGRGKAKAKAKGKAKAKATAAQAKAAQSLRERGKVGREQFQAFLDARKVAEDMLKLPWQERSRAIAEEWRRRPGWMCTKCCGKGCKRCGWKPTAASRQPAPQVPPAA